MSPLTPDQLKEIEDGFEKNRATQEAISGAERKRNRQVMLVLMTAGDEPAEDDPEFQQQLGDFARALGETGTNYSQAAIAFDAVDGGGYSLPEFMVGIVQPAIAALAALCGAWIQARCGRKVRLKIGDVEAEGKTVEEIETLLKRAADFKASVRQRTTSREPARPHHL